MAEPGPQDRALGDWEHKERFEVAKSFDLYVAWLSETAMSQATYESAALDINTGTDRYVLLRTPSAPDLLEARCAVAVWKAFQAMAQALNSDIWRVEAARFDDQLGTAMREVLDRVWLDPPPSADWSTRFDRYVCPVR